MQYLMQNSELFGESEYTYSVRKQNVENLGNLLLTFW